MRHVAIGALSIALVASGAAWWQHARAERLAVQVEALTAAVVTCSARTKNAKEAVNDAEEIDAWNGLNVVPDYWLFPEGPSID